MSDDYGSPIDRCGPIDHEKDPNSIEDFTFNWSGYLNDDTILTSEFLLDGLTLESQSNTTTSATIMVSGGDVGRIYRITNRVTTLAGRRFDQTIRIRIKEQ